MAYGDKVNPYAVAMQSTRTIAGCEFLTPKYRVELRWAMYAGQDWLWLRATNRYASSTHDMGSGTYISIPGMYLVQGLPYGSGSNQVIGSTRCTAAYSFGPSTSRSNYQVTFAGASNWAPQSEAYGTKTVIINT